MCAKGTAHFLTSPKIPDAKGIFVMIQFTPVGDSGVLAVCGSEISEQVNAQVMALDAAVQAAKALHGRRQQIARHARERAEADRALFQTAETRRLRLEHPVGVDRVADVRQQVPSLIGERHARARTHQQRHAQLLLQRLDHLAHGRLRVAEIARSVGKAVALKDLQKCDIPVHKHPSRIRNANLTIRIICFTYLYRHYIMGTVR